VGEVGLGGRWWEVLLVGVVVVVVAGVDWLGFADA
jgi:hypothetical protein